MKKMTLLALSAALALATAGYESVENFVKSKGNFSISGKFYQYDFNNDGNIAPSDWIYVTSNGQAYQLLGKTPTDNDVFGWKAVDITPQGEPLYYFINIGSGPFDWLVVSKDGTQTYKLDGATPQHTFKYSPQLNIKFSIIGESAQVQTQSQLIPPALPVQ